MSGAEMAEEMLCKLSMEDRALRCCVDIVARLLKK